jgi:hypothetical protein
LCVLALVACRDEPTIVIKFEPSDLAAARPSSVDAAPTAKAPADLGSAAAPDAGAKKASECKTAADCVVEPAECCDCANGGKQHAIPKARAQASKAARAKKCAGVMCTMMLSTDPTCGQRADCVSGACVMATKPTKPK